MCIDDSHTNCKEFYRNFSPFMRHNGRPYVNSDLWNINEICINMRQRTGIIKPDIAVEDFVLTVSDNNSRASSRVDLEQKTNCQTRIVKFFPLKIITITDGKKTSVEMCFLWRLESEEERRVKWILGILVCLCTELRRKSGSTCQSSNHLFYYGYKVLPTKLNTLLD